MKRELKDIIKVRNMETGEIKLFSGPMAVHRFMRDNKGWLIHS